MTPDARRTLLALALTPAGVPVAVSDAVRAELHGLRYLRKNGEISVGGLNAADRLYQAAPFEPALAAVVAEITRPKK